MLAVSIRSAGFAGPDLAFAAGLAVAAAAAGFDLAAAVDADFSDFSPPRPRAIAMMSATLGRSPGFNWGSATSSFGPAAAGAGSADGSAAAGSSDAAGGSADPSPDASAFRVAASIWATDIFFFSAMGSSLLSYATASKQTV